MLVVGQVKPKLQAANPSKCPKIEDGRRSDQERCALRTDASDVVAMRVVLTIMIGRYLYALTKEGMTMTAQNNNEGRASVKDCTRSRSGMWERRAVFVDVDVEVEAERGRGRGSWVVGHGSWVKTSSSR